MAAAGYSTGWALQRLKSAKRILKFTLFTLLLIAGIRYSLPPVMGFVATLPPVNASVVALLVASGFLFLGAAAFCYVLFSFLARIIQGDAGIRHDFQSIIQKAAHPMRTVLGTPPAPTAGSFTPYTDDRAYLQEQFDELVKAKILKPEDNLDDLLKTGDFDFETIRDRAVGG